MPERADPSRASTGRTRPRLPRTVPALLVLLTLVTVGLAGCLGGPVEDPGGPATEDPDEDPAYEPHVVVGVPDSGINPYHETYFRPDRTDHPCTYVRGFPCDVPALDLSVGVEDYSDALEQDQEVWDAVEPGQWYWIPKTVFIAVSCDPDTDTATNTCILDDTSMHGTGTTSSVVAENPDALIAFKEGGADHLPFRQANIPVDVFSVSWGHIAPLPLAQGTCSQLGAYKVPTPIYVLAAGNDPRPTLTDCWAAHPQTLTVGGAYAEDDTQELLAGTQPDVVSYFCRPTAQTQSVKDMRPSYCGTSFATPTVAGALSKVILELRQTSGYDGTLTDDGRVDPLLNVTVADLRDAVNRTASYDPEPRYDNTGGEYLPVQVPTGVPVNPEAPWLQWGWGFYDGWVADATVADLLDGGETQTKPAEAQAYMQAVQDASEALYV